jgi:hypothetical protein
MFFNNENEMENLVQKHHWDKVNKKLHNADAKTRLSLAAACGSSFDEDASNILVNMLNDSDEGVMIQAVKSLGDVGHDNAKTHLQSLLGRLPDGQESIKATIRDSIAKINESKRR